MPYSHIETLIAIETVVTLFTIAAFGCWAGYVVSLFTKKQQTS